MCHLLFLLLVLLVIWQLNNDLFLNLGWLSPRTQCLTVTFCSGYETALVLDFIRTTLLDNRHYLISIEILVWIQVILRAHIYSGLFLIVCPFGISNRSMLLLGFLADDVFCILVISISRIATT